MVAILIPSALSALGCAGVAWLWGRSLLRAAEPSLVGEHLQWHRRRLLLLGLSAIVAQLFLLTVNVPRHGELGWTPLAIAAVLIVVAMAAANFPARRRLLGESWSFPAYLSFGVRLSIALFGYQLLLMLSPFLVGVAGAWRWPVAASLCAALLVLVYGTQRLVPAVLRAEPLADERLREPFARVAVRSLLGEVEVFSVPTRGGVWCNAVALPGPRRSVVLFSAPLLALLDPDESAAILGHEIGHLEEREHWARLRRWRAALAVVGTLGLATVEAVGGDAVELLPVLLIPILALIQARIAGNSREHETAADRRGVELCGDADAAARALTKLHARARMVRRMAADVERRMTHPSLARRLQAIRSWQRAAENVAAPHEGECELTVHARSGRPAWARFGADAVEWDNGAGETQLLSYADLIELRIARSRRGEDLHARLRDGKRLSLPLRAQDAASVQSILDRVDGRLAPLAATSVARQTAIAMALFLASLPLLLAPWTRQFDLLVLLLVAVVAMQRRRRPWVAAAGAMGLAAAFGFLLSGVALGDSAGWALLCAAAGGAWTLWILSRAGAEEEDLPRGRARAVVLMLLLFAFPSLFDFALALVGGDVSLRLAAFGRDAQGVILPLVGMGGALALEGRWRRIAGAALVMLGLAPLLLTSRVYLDRLAQDPLAAVAPPVEYASAVASFVAETQVTDEINTWDFAVAPDGNHFAARLGDRYAEDDEVGGDSSFLLGSFAGTREKVTALALGFADSEHALAVVRGDRGVELRLFALDDLAQPLVRWPLPDAAADAYYEVTAARGQWRVRGWEDGSFAFFDGALGDAAVRRTSLEFDPEDGVEYYAADADAAFGIGAGAVAFLPPPALVQLWFRLRLPLGPRIERMGWLRDGAFEEAWRSSLPVHWCEPAPLGGELRCAGEDGRHQWIWSVDAAARSVRPVAALPAGLDWAWTGERLIVLQRDAILLLDGAGRGRRVPLAERARWGSELFANGDALLLGERAARGEGWRLRRIEITPAAVATAD